MSDLAAQQLNRSARRQLVRAQSRRERSEDKKQKKNAPNSVRFNSKKSRKVVPFCPIENVLKKDIAAATSSPKKKGSAEVIVVGQCEIEIPSEVNSFEQQGNKEHVERSGKEEEEEKEGEEKRTTATQEPPSTQEEQEETLKEMSYPSATNEEQYYASGLALESLVNDKSDPIINQDVNDKIKNDTAAATALITADSIDTQTQINLVTTTKASDETILNDTNKEIKEIKTNKDQEQQQEEEAALQKDTTPAPSMTTSASISDRVSPSTSTSSNKRKSSLISRIFKHKNSSKKDFHSIQEPCLEKETVSATATNLTEKKKKPKAWKIWKKL
ncbi:hypothetical protein [Parasitella parasitica]|uniref:Uncharacterized protein n=1 Tax=Parasitella parasitica TaxID=35722 RepID=A0A0B7N9M6_9FUNG|nr:hypothetical protein [Parasitella parasitica]